MRLLPDLGLYDDLVARLPGTPVTAIGDCTGLGLIRKATEDAARVAAAL
jgi:2,4-dienoyl-CoA reductase (NADPH2)